MDLDIFDGDIPDNENKDLPPAFYYFSLFSKCPVGKYQWP